MPTTGFYSLQDAIDAVQLQHAAQQSVKAGLKAKLCYEGFPVGDTVADLPLGQLCNALSFCPEFQEYGQHLRELAEFLIPVKYAASKASIGQRPEKPKDVKELLQKFEDSCAFWETLGGRRRQWWESLWEVVVYVIRSVIMYTGTARSSASNALLPENKKDA